MPVAANLLRSARISPKEAPRATAGGRRWLRAYLNGCTWRVLESTCGDSLSGINFLEAAEWVYRTSNFVLIGKSSVAPLYLTLNHALTSQHLDKP